MSTEASSRECSGRRRVRIGISTCPNDTFAFAPLINRLTPDHGVDFHFELLDIDQLNQKLRAGALDVGKASFFAALQLADRYRILPSGSALGFGVGPILLASTAGWTPQRIMEEPGRPVGHRFLAPGADTTAALLLRLYYGGLFLSGAASLKQVVFSRIMPGLQQKEADFGVCIHEGRFTWQAAGLHLVEDLGARWEQEMGLPLLLGGILAARSLDQELTARVQRAIHDSLVFARANPADSMPTMRVWAAEHSDDVLMEHVRLYVNDWTEDLGADGAAALAGLHRRAVTSGAIPPAARPPEIWH